MKALLTRTGGIGIILVPAMAVAAIALHSQPGDVFHQGQASPAHGPGRSTGASSAGLSSATDALGEGRATPAHGQSASTDASGCVRDPEWQCDGDVDGDGQVNPVDSGLVQSAFGSMDEQALCNYDVDCDGQINPVDSGIVQSLFGTCEKPRASCSGTVTCFRCDPCGGDLETFPLPSGYVDCETAGGSSERQHCRAWDALCDEDPPRCDDCCPGSSTSANPVHLFSGEKTERVVDLRIPGRGFDFQLVRTYRSRVERSTLLGHNWDMSYNIYFEREGDTLVLFPGDLRRDEFHLREDGAYERGEYFALVTIEENDTILMRHGDGTTRTFLPFDDPDGPGRISEIRDRNGNAMRFAYDRGRLVTVTDTLNRDITFAYDEDGHLIEVTDFIDRTVHYEYYDEGEEHGSAGDLKSVTSPVVEGTPNGNDFPNGKTWSYKYAAAFDDDRLKHNIVAFTDGRGNEFKTLAYDTDPESPNFDRVIRQDLDGDVISYVYVPQEPMPENGFASALTIVNDRMGNVEHIFFDEGNRMVRKLEYTGRAPDDEAPTTLDTNRPVDRIRPDHDPEYFETRMVWDANSRQSYRQEPPRRPGEERGPSAINAHDSGQDDPRARGNLLMSRSIRASDDPDQEPITEEYEYLEDFGGGCCGGGSEFVTRHVDGRGNVTRNDYDERGNRIETIHRIESIVEEWDYNQFGQTVLHVLPENGSGHRRRDVYTYYDAGPQRGYLETGTVDSGGFALTTTYSYDAVGNMTHTIDPNQHDTEYIYNQLNQVVRRISAEVILDGGVRYERDTFYDANDNVVRVDIQNVDDSGQIVEDNPYFTTIFEFDILNFRIRSCEEDGSFDVPRAPPKLDCDGLPEADFITTEYEFDENRNRTLVRYGEATEKRDLDNVVQTLYDERDLVFQEIRAPGVPGPGGRSTDQYDYDPDRNLVRKSSGIEQSPRVTGFAHDGFNRLAAMTDPMGNVSRYLYDDNHNRILERIEGQLIDVEGGAGNIRLSESRYEFDEMDRVTDAIVEFFDTQTQTPIDDGQSITRTQWSDNSQVLEVTNDNAHARTTVYDTANRVDTVTDAKGNVVQYHYDLDSLRVRVEETELSDLGGDPEIFNTLNAYDGLHRLTSTTDNVGNINVFSYDSRDNRTVVDDALNHETRYVYDGINRLIKTVRDMNDDGANVHAQPGDGGPDIVTTQTWDDTSRRKAQTDDSNNTTSYVYDPLNRMTAEEMADCTQHAYTFDVHDNRLTMIDANGSIATCRYDLLDRLLSKDIEPGRGVSDDTTLEHYEYDGRSRIIHARDNDSAVIRGYDSLSRVTRETLNGQTTRCLYDGVGNELKSTYPGGRVIRCTFDELERKKTITDETGEPRLIATYDYIGPGRVERREYGNGTRSDYDYDGIDNADDDHGVRRIIRTTHSKIADGTILDDRTYTWDRMYNKTKREDVRDGDPRFKHAYDDYDSIYRLRHTRVTDETDPENPVRRTTYDLDGVGNRDEVIGDPDAGDYVGPYTLTGDLCVVPGDQDMNQYTTTPFDDREYDDNGNLILRNQPGGGPPLAVITYDYRNQMVEYNDLGTGQRHTYAYDALGRRIARVVDADGAGGGPIETRYFYDGWQVNEEQDDAGATRATYVYGLYIDEVVNMQRGGSDFFYHNDDLYNVMAITHAAGTVVDRYEYADYGQPIDPDTLEPIPGHPSAIGNPYLFTGRRYDPETGWYYYRTRYLDPVAGRFTTRDTIGIWGDRANLGNGNTYVANTPFTETDPRGRGACGGGWSEWIVPDKGFTVFVGFWCTTYFNFVSACDAHDLCYRTCGQSRWTCDRDFYDDMKSWCQNRYSRWYQKCQKATCKSLAWVYYKGVRGYGYRPYSRAQSNHGCK